MRFSDDDGYSWSKPQHPTAERSRVSGDVVYQHDGDRERRLVTGSAHWCLCPWAVIAECKLERGNLTAMKLYDALLPYNQNDMIEVREAEPYSYCQFVMGKNHTAYGRARHPWLTGSAGWIYTAATKYILGVRPSYQRMVIDPCIPSNWKEFEVHRQWRGAVTTSE